MSYNAVTFRVPVTTFKEFSLGRGMCVLLKQTLFPEPHYDASTGITMRPPVQKVIAIKAIRCELGIGLKEAKDLVDSMTRPMLEAAMDGKAPEIPGTVGLAALLQRVND